jgi:hypothetical protein
MPKSLESGDFTEPGTGMVRGLRPTHHCPASASAGRLLEPEAADQAVQAVG